MTRTEYQRVYRARPENRAKQKEYQAKRYRERRPIILEAKNKPCIDCGGVFHFSVMDFDHVNGNKVFAISKNPLRNIESIKREIEKCEVVCANCHRIRTFRRSVG